MGKIHFVGVGVGFWPGLLVAVGTGVIAEAGVDDGLVVEVGKRVLVGLKVDVAGALGVDDGMPVFVVFGMEVGGGRGVDVGA